MNGDGPVRLSCFVDADGDGAIGGGDVGDEMPPMRPVEACPQQLIPCALEILCILENGGTVGPPPVETLVVTPAPSNPDLAKIGAAKRFLEEQVVDYVNSGKWKGSFSQVRKRLQTISKVLKNVPSAEPALQRIECALMLMEAAPDVKKQKLDRNRSGLMAALQATLARGNARGNSKVGMERREKDGWSGGVRKLRAAGRAGRQAGAREREAA